MLVILQNKFRYFLLNNGLDSIGNFVELLMVTETGTYELPEPITNYREIMVACFVGNINYASRTLPSTGIGKVPATRAVCGFYDSIGGKYYDCTFYCPTSTQITIYAFSNYTRVGVYAIK